MTRGRPRKPRLDLVPTHAPLQPQLVVTRPDGIERAAQVTRMAARYTTLTDHTTAQAAADFRYLCRSRVKLVKEHYKKILQPFKDAIAEVERQREDELAPWTAADATVGQAILAWLASEEVRVKAEAAAQLAEAQARADADKQAQADALRRASEAAPTVRDRKALAQQATAVEQASVLPQPVGPRPTVGKLAGTHTTERWSAEVDDADALIAGVLAGTVDRRAVQPNQEWLDAQAQQLRQDLDLPGVRAVKDTGLVSRGRS